MDNLPGNSADEQFALNAMTLFLQIGAVILLADWCY
jgi:hypothetical protein